MVEAEIKYWEENQDELWGAINTEYWKKIEDWDYSVSTEGRVINNNTNKYLKSYPNKKKDPYYRVTLSKNYETKEILLHRLVAKTFIPNYNNLSDVHHKDNNPYNNNIGNLMWMSRMENTQAVNTKKENSGYIRPRYSETDKTKIIAWEARLRHMGGEYNYYDNDKEKVETWLNDRNYEIKNKLPVTQLEIKKDPKGSVSICKNSWRVRVTLKNGDRWSKSVKTEEIGNQVKDYIIENVKNDNIKNKDDADEY
jgi:hypothetical protein